MKMSSKSLVIFKNLSTCVLRQMKNKTAAIQKVPATQFAQQWRFWFVHIFCASKLSTLEIVLSLMCRQIFSCWEWTLTNAAHILNHVTSVLIVTFNLHIFRLKSNQKKNLHSLKQRITLSLSLTLISFICFSMCFFNLLGVSMASPHIGQLYFFCLSPDHSDSSVTFVSLTSSGFLLNRLPRYELSWVLM
jgi:hypothetical protein